MRYKNENITCNICFILSSTISFSQCGASLGLNGSAIFLQMGETGLGTNISFINNLNEQFSMTYRVGILGWGNDNSGRLFIFSMSARYYLTKNNLQPYLSAELDYAIGKYKFNNGYVDVSTDEFVSYKDENKINEFLAGLGAGMIYPISEVFSLDLNYTFILTVRTNSLYHMKGSIGILYRILMN